MDFGVFETIFIEKMKTSKKITIIGIGADLREDDALGNVIAREMINNIQEELERDNAHVLNLVESELIMLDKVLIINASVIPEQFITTILSFNPDHIVIIDAAIMGNDAKPGDLAFIEPHELDKRTGSTHALPLGQFIEILKTMGLHAKFLVIGVQPKTIDYGEHLSREVRDTKVFLVSMLMNLTRRALETK